MGAILPYQKEKLVVGVLINELLADIATVRTKLIDMFGPIDIASEAFPFLHTAYYSKEMGEPLNKYLFSFTKLQDPTVLAEIKIKTNTLEEDYILLPRGRLINLDPGMLSLSKFVLASTKNFAHRIPLAKGIYGEVTLVYTKTDWKSLPWTYPDFQTVEYQSFLREVRKRLQWQYQTDVPIDRVSL